MRYAALFLWLAVPVGVWFAYEAWGTPHAIWEYEFRDNGDPYNPVAPRWYMRDAFRRASGGERQRTQSL